MQNRNMFRSAKTKFDLFELTRRIKRSLDVNFSYRKLFVLLVCLAITFYILPAIFRYLFGNKPITKDSLVQCMDDRLTPFIQNSEYDANIRHLPPMPEENDFIPYIGNGYIGLEVLSNASINIKLGRLQIPVKFQPVISLAQSNGIFREATVIEYQTGIVHRFQCLQNFFASYELYAHRTIPGILMQEIKITNTRNVIIDVDLILARYNLNLIRTRTIQLKNSNDDLQSDYEVVSGVVNTKSIENSPTIPFTAIMKKISKILTLKKRGVTILEYPIAIYYSESSVVTNEIDSVIADNELKAIDLMKKALQKLVKKTDTAVGGNDFRKMHINVWNDLWATGFSISTSKADKSINGDRINATIYAVLSQSRSYEFEEQVAISKKQEISKALAYAEGCYDAYHTLQAENLWLNMDSLQNLNNLVSSWMLTLEKQGCHNLIRAGASGVIQAMVLSFGSFRFSNQHLECKMHPKYLHRDFHFRRLNYGNKTHVNVTITVTDDNKAVIYVALDRADRSYYACDAGCLDEPVLLTQNRRQFPVKLTEPITAILYITVDKQHIEELHKAIHVKEVVEAPAHERHVIALHKHGHHLGGLPTFFWISVFAIIIVFHVFLCKLIIKEYCESPEKLRYHRYNKP